MNRVSVSLVILGGIVCGLWIWLSVYMYQGYKHPFICLEWAKVRTMDQIFVNGTSPNYLYELEDGRRWQSPEFVQDGDPICVRWGRK